jgi:hypothetical protein
LKGSEQSEGIEYRVVNTGKISLNTHACICRN